MSRPDVSPEALSPAAEALGATQPSGALEQPLSGGLEPVNLKQVTFHAFDAPELCQCLASQFPVVVNEWADGDVSCSQIARLTPCPSVVLGQWMARAYLGAQVA